MARHESLYPAAAQQHILTTAPLVAIVSGAGEIGTAELYTGKRTTRALCSRLTRERAHGDRWARAIAYTHEARAGHAGVNVETGEQTWWPAGLPVPDEGDAQVVSRSRAVGND